MTNLLPRLVIAFVLLSFGATLSIGMDSAANGELYRSFVRPPDECRIMMRWWWFGPSVTQAELERELRAMESGGIGGIEIQPVYPLSLDDPARGIKNLPFLSDEFLDALRFAAVKARDLGLRVDLTLGSGWPYGGPTIPITQAAGKLRFERALDKPPQLREGETLVATIPQKDSREVLYAIASRTRMMVKRASAGAEGFVLDHYNRAALENHLSHVGERLFQGFGSNPPYAIFCDSLEVFGSDWTDDFLPEFQRRRGYDLKPFLPALATNIGENTEAIRHDWGLTLTELAEERFLIPLTEWAHSRKTLARVQAYGVPPVALGSQALVDLAEGEGSQWHQFSSSRWASSANHLLGRPITSSETWTWLHSPAFAASPLDMKAEADRHFLQGVNQLVGHGWPYSPESVGKPGWSLYAAAVFNDNNPWWPVMPDVARYLQRISYMMRQGVPISDIALYLPTADARAHFALGEVSINRSMDRLLGPALIPALIKQGYYFDGIDDTLIERFTSVENGALRAKGGSYPIVILPGVERIPVATYRKLESFARKGGHLIATRRLPSRAPGFLDAEAQTREIREISRRLFEQPGSPGHFVELVETGLGSLLERLRPPDVSLKPKNEDIGFVHRHTQSVEIYFLANTSNVPFEGRASFRVEGMNAAWWDPLKGRISPARVIPAGAGRTSVEVDLPPYGSKLMVFTRNPIPVNGPPPPSVSLPQPINLDADWTVHFDGIERTVQMNRLQSWTEIAETRFFSGQATYERSFSVVPELLRSGVAWVLDFGKGTPIEEVTQKQAGMRAWLNSPVRDACVVYVNGQRAGSVWCPPYEVEVTPLLRLGKNAIRIQVANTAINRLAGSRPVDYAPLNRHFGVRFVSQDMDNLKPLPSGLLGDVRLVALPAFSERRGEARRPDSINRTPPIIATQDSECSMKAKDHRTAAAKGRCCSVGRQWTHFYPLNLSTNEE